MSPGTGMDPERLRAVLARAWRLDAVSLDRLGGENENWRVTTRNGTRYVLKVAAPGTPPELLELEAAAMEAVRARSAGVQVSRVVPTTEGSLALELDEAGRRRPARLLTYLEGTVWDEAGPASAERLRGVGRSVAEVARALGGVDHPAARRTHRWDLSTAGGLREKTRFVEDEAGKTRVREAFRLWAGYAPLLAEVPRGLIHGDLNHENVLVDGEEVVGILDFGDALENPWVCDLAIALTYLLLDEPDPWAAGAWIVAGYHEVRPLEPQEVELLHPLVCGRLAVSLVTAAERRSIDPDRSAWFSSEDQAWRALERWLSLDPVEASDRLAARAGLRVHADRGLPPDALRARREARVGGALSLSYATPLEAVRGRGAHLFDERGRPHLDLYNNVCHVGHCHPRVVTAGQRQMARLNTNTRYLHPLLVEYAERLCATLPPGLDRCFLVNSGSEANELAVRLARTHTGRRDVVVLENAYHGHTTALLELSPYKFDGPGGDGRKPWVHVAPMPDGYRGPHRGSGREVGEAYGDAVGRIVAEMEAPPAAFLAESLPSVGGQIVPPEGYFETAFRHVRDAGGLCVLDEVQVGFGRVGTHFWGFERQGVVPDVVVLGKPMGNGHPMGAVVTTEAVARSFADTGMEFFSTFGGNPVSCAIGLAVLDVIRDEGLQARAREVGAALLEGLRGLQDRHRVVGDVRGTGLFLGVELVEDRESRAPSPEKARRLVEDLRRHRILTGTDGPWENVVKIKPPMVLSRADAAVAVEVMDEVLRDPAYRV